MHCLAEKVIARAVASGTSLGTAESLTGGLIAGTLTSVSGSSNVMRGGVVSYALDVKRDVLGVSAQLLDEVGAVDGEVACQMAEGARRVLDAHVAVAVTGIAGPTGAEPGKPVGTVWMAIATDDVCTSQLHVFSGNREQIRLQTVREALRLFLSVLGE